MTLTAHERLAAKEITTLYNEYVGGLLIDQMDNGRTEENMQTAKDVALAVVSGFFKTNPKEVRFVGKEFIVLKVICLIVYETEYDFDERKPIDLYHFLMN